MRTSVCVHRAAPVANGASVVVTCVHGTWARGSRWPRLETIVAGALEVCGPITVQYFEWSGRNSVKARTQAAADLRHLLIEQIARAPDSRHVLVAHSHGANVVLHAIGAVADGKAAIRDALAGIVLLSPPLLDCRVVEQAGAAANRLLLAAVATVPLLVLAGRYVRVTFGLSDIPALSALVVTTIAWLLMFRPSAVRRRAESLARQLALPRLEFPGLVIRATRDEATFALSSVTAFARMAGDVWSRVLRVRAPFQRQQERRLREARESRDVARAVFEMFTLVPMSITLVSSAQGAAVGGHWFTFAMTLPVAIVMGTAALVVVAGSLVLLMLLPAFSFLLWPVGIFPTAAAALLAVSVEGAPTPAWQVVHCEKDGLTGWGHSVHEQLAALECIDTYLRGVLARS